MKYDIIIRAINPDSRIDDKLQKQLNHILAIKLNPEQLWALFDLLRPHLDIGMNASDIRKIIRKNIVESNGEPDTINNTLTVFDRLYGILFFHQQQHPENHMKYASIQSSIIQMLCTRIDGDFLPLFTSTNTDASILGNVLRQTDQWYFMELIYHAISIIVDNVPGNKISAHIGELIRTKFVEEGSTNVLAHNIIVGECCD